MVYKEDHSYLPLSATIPLLIGTTLIHGVPWLVDFILCVCLIYQIRKANAFHKRLVNASSSSNEQSVISKSELKVTSILVCHCICHIGCSSAEIVYLPLSFIMMTKALNLNRFLSFALLFSPVSYMLLSIPLTVKSLRGFTTLVKAKLGQAVQSVRSWFTIESYTHGE